MHADGERLVSVVKMATMLMECTAKEKRFIAGLRNMADVLLMMKRLKWRCGSG
jgi:hypothetical protein